MKHRQYWTLSLLLLAAIVSGNLISCTKMPEGTDVPGSDRKIQYMMFMFSNKHIDEIEDYLPEMKQLYGEIDPESDRMYSFGVVGPMLLTQSIEQMQQVINTGFDYALTYDIPVYFQLDDVTNYSKYYGSGAETRFYEHPEMCEWIQFPEKGEKWGGQNDYGKLPAFWFNWGIWMRSPAFPNLASPEFKALIADNLQKGVLEPIHKRYEELQRKGKTHLFAGMAIGWETHIPDYSDNNTILGLDKTNPPSDTITGETMEQWEYAQYGYAALHTLGYDQGKLEAEATRNGKSAQAYMKTLLYDVIHDFSEFMAKQAFDSGLPRHKIFTHMVSLSTSLIVQSTFNPPTWCAVNPYSTPGFTMSPVTCPYDMPTLKDDILSADPAMNNFGCVEGYAAGLKDEEKADEYLHDMFSNGALMVAVFSYADQGTRLFHFSRSPDFGFNKSVVKWLNQ
ncbi:MAG: hypothetical protein ACYCYM_12080 [Saccharofermentanales bacterium]